MEPDPVIIPCDSDNDEDKVEGQIRTQLIYQINHPGVHPNTTGVSVWQSVSFFSPHKFLILSCDWSVQFIKIALVDSHWSK